MGPGRDATGGVGGSVRGSAGLMRVPRHAAAERTRARSPRERTFMRAASARRPVGPETTTVPGDAAPRTRKPSTREVPSRDRSSIPAYTAAILPIGRNLAGLPPVVTAARQTGGARVRAGIRRALATDERARTRAPRPHRIPKARHMLAIYIVMRGAGRSGRRIGACLTAPEGATGRRRGSRGNSGTLADRPRRRGRGRSRRGTRASRARRGRRRTPPRGSSARPS